MAIQISKYTRYVPWDDTGVGAPRRQGTGPTEVIVDLSNYYTKSQLVNPRESQVWFGNIIDAFHNDMIGLQGGLVDSSGSSGEDFEFYHLDEQTYTRVVSWEFTGSLVEYSDGSIQLEGDVENPGSSKYYGTNTNGTKGWYDLSQAGSSLWVQNAQNDLTPASPGVGICIDDIYIKNNTIHRSVGNFKNISINAGNAFGSNSVGGSLFLKAGNAITNDNTTQRGHVYLVPGNSYSSNDSGYIFLGDESSNLGILNVQPMGTLTNITVSLSSKGTSPISLASPSGPAYISSPVSISLYTPEINLGGMDVNEVKIKVTSIHGQNGKNLTITAGDVTGGGNYDGGDLFIYGGTGVGSGIRGNVYLGNGLSGMLPEAESFDTYNVTYNPTTGKLSYAPFSDIGASLPFQTATFNTNLNINCSSYKNWICTITDNCTINISNVQDGDRGTLELIMTPLPSDKIISVYLGSSWTKKIEGKEIDPSNGMDNIIEWTAVGSGSDQEIIYRIDMVEPQRKLVLTFDNITNVPVSTAGDVNQWNTWFGLPTNGIPFSSVTINGAVVTLSGGRNIRLSNFLFSGNDCRSHILKIEDTGCVSEIGIATFGLSEGDTSEGCANLTRAIFPLVRIIGHSTFSNCLTLSDLQLPSLVGRIPTAAFMFCSLQRFVISNKVTRIGARALLGNYSLYSINIPENVTHIEDDVFKSCTKLKFVTMYPEIAPVVDNSSFDDVMATLHIKTGATGYNIPPWTNTSKFETIIYDL